MANNATRVPIRNRPGAQRIKADENATSRHLRQSSGVTAPGAPRTTFTNAVVNGLKGSIARPALGEVTTIAVNRKDTASRLAGKEKEGPEPALKRNRSTSLAAATIPQRVPLGPGRIKQTSSRQPLRSVGAPPTAPANKRISRLAPPERIIVEDDDEGVNILVESDNDNGMQVEPDAVEAESSLIKGEEEVEAMVGVEVESSEEEEELEETAKVEPKPPRVWPEISTERAERCRREIDAIRETFDDEVDMYDTTMVSEYSDEIFEYMCDLEESVMPSADYMSGQNEVTWDMRQTLVDWLLQVHLRYHMLPETLWIAVNIVDRFLTKRVVSLVKLQLVGVTAMFVASKYEEILAPSVDEFVFMTENGYSKEEILKGERIVLQTLDFKVSHYCSPYSWMRRISKADDYDIQTRTLSKFLTEATLLDYRFLRVKPSLVAAVGMFTARKMLGGDWNEAFVFYSGYTEEQLIPGHNLLIDKLTEQNFNRLYVYKKYAHKKFLKASIFAIEWATANINGEAGVEVMMLEE